MAPRPNMNQSSLSKKNFQSLTTACLMSRNGTGAVNGRKLGLYNADPRVACVKPSQHKSIVRIRWSSKLLQDVVKQVLCTIRRQIGEDNDE